MITPTAELSTLWCLPTASARPCRHVPGVCTLRISQLFSGPPYHTQKNLSCRGLQTSTEIMPPFFFFFSPLSDMKKTYRIRRCFRTGLNAKDKASDWLIIQRGAADITHDHQKVSLFSLFFVLASSPEGTVSSSSEASCRLSCFLHSLTLLEVLLLYSAPSLLHVAPSWSPALPVPQSILFSSSRIS